MDLTHTENVKKSVRVYITVFVALMGLTIITVAISTFHLTVGASIAVALFIAAIKAGLVASYFMHLISEKKVIYATLIITAVFFAALMFLPVSHYLEPMGN
jgi:cytochrome c oxidase subunit IV